MIFSFLIFIPPIIAGSIVCPKSKTTCPVDKQCCVVHGDYSCCNPEDDQDMSDLGIQVLPALQIVSSAEFEYTSFYANDSILQNGPGCDLYCGGNCCPFKPAKCCNGKSCCPPVFPCCGNNCCRGGAKCCDEKTCCPTSSTCCDDGCCLHSQGICCGDNKCCPASNTCCGEGCCPNAMKCCGGNMCCPASKPCCGDVCCRHTNGTCCGGNKCCPASNKCCGDGCCPIERECCGGNKCCPASSTCCGNVCCNRGELCCGSWCCKEGSKCGSSMDQPCINKGAIISAEITVLLLLAVTVFVNHRL